MDYLLTAHRFEDKMRMSFRNLIALTACLLWINFANASDWQAELIETEALIAQAKSTGGLWRDTEKLLNQAKELYKNGNELNAGELLKEVKQQANLGYQQMSEQSSNLFVPYYLQH